ncbi:hybrid sensor histidine kinase/response regulator [Roseibium sediminicola]|uniref:histidine kinase n=1 Tax=Roseibium sediminicola TaxID=2933272 RepID=A0ABT0GSN1_9HYPH|nr:response regulator [Roseibium sp. CAU 1639]MCK7612296.1 response regulator [Roseibium sp. CAU 1639]
MADQDEDSVKLALLAHDLRTPLAAMRLTAELIGTGPLNATQTEQLSILIRSIDALTQMTGDLVAEAGPGKVTEGAPCRVDGIVREVTDLFQVAANAKGLSLDVSVETAAQDLWTSRTASLRRVVTTLLDNAVKYTSEGGIKVALTAQRVEDGKDSAQVMVRLSVTDSGPGIDPEEGARLFRPFVRGRHGRETGAGSGLGLWGTELMMQDMQGRLYLERPEEGGSRFIVEFPAGTDGEHLPVEANVLPGPTETKGLAPMHALVVDDNETNCRLLSALLESFGITTDVARSGEQAIDLVRQRGYDAALLDLHMPDMSGVETAERLRALRGETELPLIAVTAALEAVGDHQLRDAGFQDMLTKPLSPAALYDAMDLARRLKQPGL